MSADATVQGVPVTPSDLDRAIRETLARPEFAWRLPRSGAIAADDEGGIVSRFVTQFGEWLEKALRYAWDWIEKILEWIDEHFAMEEPSGSGYWQLEPQLLLFVALAVAAAALAVVLLRLAARRRRQRAVAARPVEGIPDITAEHVSADRLPADDWMSMARDFMQRGEWRFGVRAMFLAALAHLSEHRRITVAPYKSNREYSLELRRRAHDRRDLLAAFHENLGLFEEAWYGTRRLSAQTLACFNSNQEIILSDRETQV